jgi:hypothetical protein
VKFGRCDNLVNCPGHLEGIKGYTCARKSTCPRNAGVAQSVEHLICNQGVRGSNPFASSSKRNSENEFPAGSGILRWRNRFFQHTSFGTVPACSDLRGYSVSAILGFPGLPKSGLRKSGLRKSGLRKSGLRNSGLRNSGLRNSDWRSTCFGGSGFGESGFGESGELKCAAAAAGFC